MDIIVSETRFERTEGLYMWGRSGSGGYSPNCRVQFLGNTVLEGNHLWNYNGSYPYPHPKTIEPYSIGVRDRVSDFFSFFRVCPLLFL